MEELVGEVTVNIRVVEHRVTSLVCPTLFLLKELLTSPFPQVEDICHSITVLSSILQLKTAASSGQTILLPVRRPQQAKRGI